MKQIDLIDVHVTAPYYFQCNVSVFCAGDYEMSISRFQNGSKFYTNYLYKSIYTNYEKKFIKS